MRAVMPDESISRAETAPCARYGKAPKRWARWLCRKSPCGNKRSPDAPNKTERPNGIRRGGLDLFHSGSAILRRPARLLSAEEIGHEEVPGSSRSLRFASVAALDRWAYAKTRAAMLSVAGVAQPVAANVPDANKPIGIALRIRAPWKATKIVPSALPAKQSTPESKS
jgi:hypothetical protein